MNHSRRENAESRVAELIVIPGEELWGEITSILQRPKRSGKPGRYFQRPEMAFRIRVVVGDMRATGPGDAEVRHQKGDGFEDVMEEPRVTRIVSFPGSIACLPQVSAMSRLAQLELSPSATIQPTT